MKTILAMVMSLDGKTTKWHRSKIHEWTSPEDKKYFVALLKKQEVVILGKNTYEAAKTFITKSLSGRKIVLTTDPKKYLTEEKSEQLEFLNDSPFRLVERLKLQRVKTALLIGGEKTNTAFLKAGLVDEIWVTVEPLIFGTGNGLFSEEEFSTTLKLLAVKKLNWKGSLLLKYKVLKNI